MKVGMFDSGVGGLAVLEALRKKSPGWDFVYLADTSRAPFGVKSEEKLISIVRQDVSFLISKGVDIIVAACNTADSIVKKHSMEFPVPYFSLIESVGSVEGNSVVLSTKATAIMGVYSSEFPGTIQMEAQDLVGVVEDGEGIERAVEGYAEKLKNYDNVILGCTHFSLVSDVFRKFGLNVIDPVENLAERLESLFEDGNGKIWVYVNGDPEVFEKKVEKFGVLKDAEVFYERVNLDEEVRGDIGVVGSR